MRSSRQKLVTLFQGPSLPWVIFCLATTVKMPPARFKKIVTSLLWVNKFLNLPPLPPKFGSKLFETPMRLQPFFLARSETRATRATQATRANIFIAKTLSNSIISTFLGHRKHKNLLLFKIGHFLKFTRVARVFVLDL